MNLCTTHATRAAPAPATPPTSTAASVTTPKPAHFRPIDDAPVVTVVRTSGALRTADAVRGASAPRARARTSPTRVSAATAPPPRSPAR